MVMRLPAQQKAAAGREYLYRQSDECSVAQKARAPSFFYRLK
jgi:hypothetical protein